MWGPYPNNAWGYGKVDAFGALTTCSLNVAVSQLHSDIVSCIIYPNPATSILNIEITGSKRNKIAVCDMQGRILIQSDFYLDNFSIPLNPDSKKKDNWVFGMYTGPFTIIDPNGKEVTQTKVLQDLAAKVRAIEASIKSKKSKSSIPGTVPETLIGDEHA